MLEILPGIGVALPDGAGTLAFGMPPGEVRALLTAATGTHRGMQCMSLTRTDYTELRHAHDAWLSGMLFDPAWTTVAAFGGVVMTVAGGGPVGPDRLSRIGIERDLSPSRGGSAAVPVPWDGVDLFGHPRHDVVSVLPEVTRPFAPSAADAMVESLGLWLRGRTSADDHWSQLVLLATPSGWEPCCPGTFACVEGGDGLVGILR